ncbi:Appr-1-p processing protein [Halovibrio salipaludis]|uniref:Appr-1-p processing protein n=1 Tax=Halovibrio salipaludis TaxID=2032626 RepID=A0A2A2EZA1_9GAMM|nr:macro domain-containing protein [Halovibrio salipaludis]PAU77687.1 Appr-1-p processing protein [Halovibrio salipaludis]
MIEYTEGNLLEADVDALVNTVNTVGVMGKGIALMFKEAFPENFKAYAQACKSQTVQPGKMFVTERSDLVGPRWVINFPTKQHWRSPSKPEWIADGLHDLKRVILEHDIKSIAIPPLGSGNGGLDWSTVKPMIEETLGDLTEVRIVVYEPTAQYQNVTRRTGVEKLTPPRALIAELVRRYWVLGIECSLLEIQKLAWFMERAINKTGLKDPMDLRFEANRYGPYADRLRHLLDSLDGSYLQCEKRLGDAKPEDVIWFDQSRKEKVAVYLKSGEAQAYTPALDKVSSLIDGFQSPLGMEVLATVDWLIAREGCEPNLKSIKAGLKKWPAGEQAATRKASLFSDAMLQHAITRLQQF